MPHASRSASSAGSHALIQAAVLGDDTVTGDFLQDQLAAHPIYDPAGSVTHDHNRLRYFVPATGPAGGTTAAKRRAANIRVARLR